MDKVVIDIETKNTFSDVGGKQFLNKLDVSFWEFILIVRMLIFLFLKTR